MAFAGAILQEEHIKKATAKAACALGAITPVAVRARDTTDADIEELSAGLLRPPEKAAAERIFAGNGIVITSHP